MSDDNVGARSYGGKRRHGLAWVPWLALLLLALIAFLIFALLRNVGDDGDKSGIDLKNDSIAASTANESGTSKSTSGSMSDSSTGSAGAGVLTGGGGAAAADSQTSSTSAVKGTVLFAEDSAQIDGQSQAVIVQAAKLLQAQGAKGATVTGYTDVVGGAPVNDTLAQQRADAVAAQLRSILGNGVEIVAVSKGEDDPVAPNQNADGTDNPENRQQNRRAVIAAA